MIQRRVHENIKLDLSLRQSRSIWLTFSIVMAPLSLIGVGLIVEELESLYMAFKHGASFGLSTVLGLVFGVFAASTVFFCFGRFREATRRLKRLETDPNADVKPLPAPFKASLFGPYH